MALLGLINNPLIGQDGMIAADTPMIIAYALAGAALLGTSFSGESTCAFALYTVAAFSALLGGYALYMMGSYNNIKILDLLVASRSGVILPNCTCIDLCHVRKNEHCKSATVSRIGSAGTALPRASTIEDSYAQYFAFVHLPSRSSSH